MTCKKCGSFAVNPDLHGREPGVDLDLCDVCYWRARAELFEGLDWEEIAHLYTRDAAHFEALGFEHEQEDSLEKAAKIRADFEKTEG